MTEIFIPGYISFDPKRDLKLGVVSRLHRARGVRRQGVVFSVAWKEHEENAKLAFEYNEQRTEKEKNQREAEIAKLKVEIASQDKALTLCSRYARHKRKAAMEKDAEIHALEAQNEDLHKHLSERLIQIIDLKDELATKDAEIEQLKEELDEIRKERLIYKAAVVSLKGDIKVKDAKIERLEAENDRISILTLRYMRGLDAEQMRDLPVSEKFALIERLQAELAQMP